MLQVVSCHEAEDVVHVNIPPAALFKVLSDHTARCIETLPVLRAEDRDGHFVGI